MGFLFVCFFLLFFGQPEEIECDQQVKTPQRFCLNIKNFLVVTAAQRRRSYYERWSTFCHWKLSNIGHVGLKRGFSFEGVLFKKRQGPHVSTTYVNKTVPAPFCVPHQIQAPPCSVSWKAAPWMTSPGSLTSGCQSHLATVSSARWWEGRVGRASTLLPEEQ